MGGNNEEKGSHRTFCDGDISALFVMISASRDSEKSAGIATVDKEFSLPMSPAGNSGGVFTSALLQALNELTPKQEVSWMQVMERLRAIVNDKGFSTQVPQLSSSIVLNVLDPFLIVPPLVDNKRRRRRRAILIGINYVGQRGFHLTGCHNDVLNMKKYLSAHHGFDEQDMAILMDDGKHALPNKANIEMAFDLMSSHSNEGDVVFVHYSGHGKQFQDLDGDEIDGLDEAILPCDFSTSGPIVDDDIYNRFVLPMRKGVHVVSLMDSCHSGTGMDLPYIIRVGEPVMKRNSKFGMDLKPLTVDEMERSKAMRRTSAKPFRESFTSATSGTI